MKKTFISASLVALGTASLHASTYAPDVTTMMDAGKPWSVSGTLRGFYDDNYTTGHNDAQGKRASWGFEFSPSINLIIPLQQTELGLRYTYGLYYWQDRQSQGANPIDQTHQLDLWIDHAFTERLEGKVSDTFIVAQDPQLTATGTSEPYREEGNNINNIGTVTLHTELSLLFSTDLGYQNTYVSYQNHGATVASIEGGGSASLAGLLDEDSHSIWLNFNYQYSPELSFLVGYQFGYNDYIGGEPTGEKPFVTGDLYYSDNDNSYSHYVYLGTQYSMSQNLSATAKVGAQYTDNYNLPSFDPQSGSSFAPYAEIAVTYTYLPGDYVQAGFTQSENSSAQANVSGTGGITLFEESSVLYASLNHQITPELMGNVIARYQYSAFHGGSSDGQGQDFYTLDVNLTYNFNEHLSAELGYNFDYLAATTTTPSYSRNQEYLGITATY